MSGIAGFLKSAIALRVAMWNESGDALVDPNSGIARQAFTLFGGSAVKVSKVGTGLVALGQVLIPANTIGANGVLRWRFKFSHTSNVNSKTLYVHLGPLGTTADPKVMHGASSANTVGDLAGEVANRNSAASQIAGFNNSLATGLTNVVFYETTVDTTVDTYVTFAVSNANAADTYSLESYFVEVLRRA